jgi:anthranilate synthase component I
MPLRAQLRREVPAAPAQLRWLATHRCEEFPLFLDSAASGEGAAADALGRYSMLFATAEETLLLRGDGRLEVPSGALCDGDFLAALDAWWLRERLPGAVSDNPESAASERLPFRGGWAVYLAYELAAQIEVGLDIPALGADAICALALRVRSAIIYDHALGRCHVVAEAGAEQQLPRLIAALADAPLPAATASEPAQPPRAAAALSEQHEDAYRDAVLSAKEYIAAGDIYQANLSRGWRLTLAGQHHAAQLYERLRQANPAPFAAFATLPGLTVLSSSPERLVRVSGGRVDTRPIAGTRARSGAVDADTEEQSQLLAHPKERAEHVMLIDLERNDLGRICRAGSVEVSEFMVTESYRHVHHIVSNVRGVLRENITPGQVLRAVFPGGTITGCPKYRCMQIIGELEGEPRGAYTGSLGYINLDGSMDFNILIRTATLQGNELAFRAGAGIVADSDWQRELAETRAKAQGMVSAFGGAQ